jgi:hypothetical protein
MNAFQWNRGGWFGAQIGSSAYLIILGLALVTVDLTLGIIIALCGVIPNIMGLMMWKRREIISPYSAFQYLLLTIFVFTTVALCASVFGEQVKNIEQLNGSTKMMWLPLMFLALMFIFHRKEKSSKLTQQDKD